MVRGGQGSLCGMGPRSDSPWPMDKEQRGLVALEQRANESREQWSQGRN